MRHTIMTRREGIAAAQERTAFMLKYEGLRIMREMRLENPDQSEPKPSLHDLREEDAPKTRGDGKPITLVDLIMDERYAEREHDSEYYDEDYYFSEEDSDDSDGAEGREDEMEEGREDELEEDNEWVYDYSDDEEFKEGELDEISR